MDPIRKTLSNRSELKLVLLSCITRRAPKNCLSTFVEVAGIEKTRRARRDKRGNFSC